MMQGHLRGAFCFPLLLLLLGSGCSDGGTTGGTEDAGSSQRLCLPGEELDNRGRCRCVSDEACPSGKICEDGRCQRGCHTDDQCEANEICEGLSCIGGCRSDDQCGEGMICRGDNSCARGCRTDDQCQAGQHCTAANECRDPCQSHTDCARNEFCDGVCDDDADCLGGGVCQNGRCDNASGRCLEGCRTPDVCGGPATCDAGTCNCTEFSAFTVLEARDGNDQPGVTNGDVVNITLKIPHQHEGDEQVMVALVLQFYNLEGSGHENASLNEMDFASRWGRWGQNPAVLINLNGADASMTFTARIGAENRPGLIRAELASYDPDVEGPCRQALANTRSWAVLGADSADSLPQEACIDLIWTRSVHLLPGQARAPVTELANARREDLQLGETTPNLARDVKVCIRGTNGQALPVAGDWRGESPIAVSGRLVLEGLRPWDTGACERRGDCGSDEACVSGRCRERFIKGVIGGDQPLRDRDEEDELVTEVTGASCLSTCAPPPLRSAAPAWAPGALDLNDYLPRTRDTELRMSVISAGDEAGWSDLFLLPQAAPDWLTSRSCVCTDDGGIDCTEGAVGTAVAACP